jgi:hypothetical protein
MLIDSTFLHGQGEKVLNRADENLFFSCSRQILSISLSPKFSRPLPFHRAIRKLRLVQTTQCPPGTGATRQSAVRLIRPEQNRAKIQIYTYGICETPMGLGRNDWVFELLTATCLRLFDLFNSLALVLFPITDFFLIAITELLNAKGATVSYVEALRKLQSNRGRKSGRIVNITKKLIVGRAIFFHGGE